MREIYIGAGGKARRVSRMYVGVNGVARYVKKAYIGVDGVARLFYWRADAATAMGSKSRERLCGHVGDYLVFFDNEAQQTAAQRAYAYDGNLVMTELGVWGYVYDFGLAENPGYLLVGGGVYYENGRNAYTDLVIAYNSSLVSNFAPDLSRAKAVPSACGVGNYAILAGGCYSKSNNTYLFGTDADAYNRSLVRTKPTGLAGDETSSGSFNALTARRPAAMVGGSKAVFLGRFGEITGYNASLSRSTGSVAYGHYGASRGQYALFGDAATIYAVTSGLAVASTLDVSPYFSGQGYYMDAAGGESRALIAGLGRAIAVSDNLTIARKEELPFSAKRKVTVGHIGGYFLINGFGGQSNNNVAQIRDQ